MDLSFLSPDIQISNDYYFTLKNAEGKVIQQEVVHNEAQWRRYIRRRMTNLSLYLGVFTARDALKYQTNGYWNEGYAAQISGKTITDSSGNEIFIPTGGYTVESGKQYKVDEPNVIFRPDMKKNPSSLFGTQVFERGMNWSCDKIYKDSEGKYAIKYIGKTTWGYHSDTNPYNEYHESSGNASDAGFDFGKQSSSENKFGIKLFDGGLGSHNLGLFTHFATSIIKAPTEILEITVIVTFMRIKHMAGGSMIAPCMNAEFGHSLNNPNTSLTNFYPSTLSVSVYPSYTVQNTDEIPTDMEDYENFQTAITGQIPPIGSYNLFNLYSFDAYDQWLATDTPKDWDEETDGTWYGFPLYLGNGKGSPYVMRTEILKDGTEVQKYVYDTDGTRRISFSDLEPSTVLKYRSSCIGPIKCSMVNGFAISGSNDFVPQNGDSHEVTFINIGSGDGVRTRFYHPFIDGITKAYYTVGSSMHYADEEDITYYSPSYNIFAKYPNFSCYRDGEKLFSHRPISVDGSPSLPINNRIFNEELADRKNIEHPYSAYQNYFPESKQTIFGLHPFDNNYYPTRGLLGKNEIIVHDFITAGKIIGSGWNGLDRDQWWSAPMYIITGDNEDEVGQGIGRQIMLQSFPSQHDETRFNFECDRYVGFRGGEYWQLGSAYAGGLRYSGYTPMSVRITEGQNNEVEGYIEFDQPVPANAKVYVDVDFSDTPFLGNFSEVMAKGYFSLGSKKDNGILT